MVFYDGSAGQSPSLGVCGMGETLIIGGMGTNGGEEFFGVLIAENESCMLLDGTIA